MRLKNTNFTENILETSHFYSIWKTSRPKNTRISFLHKAFQKTLKIPEIRILYPKKYDEIPITLPWKSPPLPRGGQNELFICRSFAFCMTKRLFPASRSKVWEEKRKWNLPPSGKRPSFIRRRKSFHQNQYSHRVSQKNC